MKLAPDWATGQCVDCQRVVQPSTKVASRFGEPLALGPTGTIPKGCYFVATDHKDGFDSRYAAIGWICARSVLGVGRPVL